MTPAEFVSKWQRSTLKERSASQSHFNDLCRLLNLPEPNTADPTGTGYTLRQTSTQRLSLIDVTAGK